jgi:outer membrane protein TolC
VASYAQTLEAVRQEAVLSRQRAIAALREAMGLSMDCRLELVDERLPLPEPAVCREEVLAWAVANHPELEQAALAAELAELEVKAQAAQCRLTARTFAADSDQHTQRPPRELPLGTHEPPPTGPEMPISLTGFKCNRVERARALSARAAEAVEKTRLRMSRKAEDVYRQWREAREKLELQKQAGDQADQLFESLAKDFTDPVLSTKVRIIDLVNAKVEATQLRGSANSGHFDFIISLLAMEEVTGGAFCSGLAGASGSGP